MDSTDPFKVEELDSPLQRVISRRREFFIIPAVATILAVIALAWEIVRQNLPAAMISHWPWRLELLDLQSGATVVTVLLVVLFTRAQYAEVVRPVINWALRHESLDNHRYSLKGRAPTLLLVIYNTGGGVAVVESFEYRFARNEDSVPSPWVTPDRLHEYLSAAGLHNQEDYFFKGTGPGYSYPPNTNREGASLVGAIRLEALVRFRVFDIRLRVRDAVGDLHERVLPCRARISDADIVAALPNRHRWRFILAATRRSQSRRRSAVSKGKR